MPVIEKLIGREILDSRGRPTVGATCILRGGVRAWASVPSGASTGKAEAVELRDGDPNRYGGLGCRAAAENVSGAIHRAVTGREFPSQEQFDRTLIELDGTNNKSRLGANAILAASIAFARAVAREKKIPLYQHFATLVGASAKLPRLTINLFSGGKHAGGQVQIQDVLVVPSAGQSIDQSLATTYAVYQAAGRITQKRYNARPLVADEGGLAPPFENVEAMMRIAVEAILDAGFRPGADVELAIDVASSHFYRDGNYHLADRPLSGMEMVKQIQRWTDEFPIMSVEDGLAEEDWEHWPRLLEAIGSKALVMGDDLLCTNPARIKKAIDAGAANALLLKVNQIGTLTEAAEAYRIAKAAGWRITISARSGETEDDWLADLATGWAGDFIKIGSITRSERLAKYNRLLEIEAEPLWCSPSGLPGSPEGLHHNAQPKSGL